jgi:hypothetical protein
MQRGKPIMRTRSAAAVLAAVVAAVCATPAAAKCQRFSYLVNDYGKEGPTRDAKNLLDKHIVEWAKGKGIKNYTVGKKDVKCVLFLNFVVFDEHTCTATAQVCWGDGEQAEPTTPAAKPAPAAKKPPSAKKANVPG